MKTTRLKISLPTLATRDDAEALFGDLALTTVNRIRVSNKMDAELTAVRQKYEGNLAAMDEDLKQKTDTLRAWAEANPDQFPKGRKSIQFVHGTIGFRTGNPTLKLLSRAWTWDKVLKTIIELGLSNRFIRTKEEVDKEAIIAADSTNATMASAAIACSSFGTKVVQDESFFVDPIITEVDARQTSAA
jgi:phage host-nuclease inhibitor protein Gam